MKRTIPFPFAIVAGFLPMLAWGSSAPAADRVVPQWTRFEQAFVSSEAYDNPVQQVKVRVEFTGPHRNKRTFLAFWDGGRLWRIRFSPDEPGNWTYATVCSDKNNKGLHNQFGSFQCDEYTGVLPLFRHGELRLSKNRRYFEHSDGTPFFFLADTVWCGPLFADLDDLNNL